MLPWLGISALGNSFTTKLVVQYCGRLNWRYNKGHDNDTTTTEGEMMNKAETFKPSLAETTYQLGQHLYYSAQRFNDELRIRIYVVVNNELHGVDQLLTPEHCDLLDVFRTPFAYNRVDGPGGLVLRDGHPRYYTSYALVDSVGRLLGDEREPIAI